MFLGLLSPEDELQGRVQSAKFAFPAINFCGHQAREVSAESSVPSSGEEVTRDTFLEWWML